MPRSPVSAHFMPRCSLSAQQERLVWRIRAGRAARCRRGGRTIGGRAAKNGAQGGTIAAGGYFSTICCFRLCVSSTFLLGVSAYRLTSSHGCWSHLYLPRGILAPSY
jgi:hypothetical protein